MVTALKAVSEFWRNHYRWSKARREVVDHVSYDELLYEVGVYDDHIDLDITECLADAKPQHKRIMFLLMLGYKPLEIASILNISHFMIYKVREHLRIVNSESFSTLHTASPTKR
jgi:DNA-directed RNA polymerase specialized sigma24 family protein